MQRWLRKLRGELEAEREATAQARAVSRDILHEVADVVLKLRAAAEDLERVLGDMEKQDKDAEEKARGATPPGSTGIPPDGATTRES